MQELTLTKTRLFEGVWEGVITGAGDKAFASGTDISQFRAFKTAQVIVPVDLPARIEAALSAADGPAARHVFIALDEARIRGAAMASRARLQAGTPLSAVDGDALTATYA